MGFDIFFDCFDRGEPADFPIALIERGFGRYAEGKGPECWVLLYPDGARSELFVDATEANVSDFMVARPPVHPEFWRAIFDLLRETPSCLYWPGGGPVIANPAVREHLPPEMIEALGEPTIVSAGEQILEEIEKS
jgi:hypothetical protein